MRLREDQLIEYIKNQTGPGPKPPFLGIGDDAALIGTLKSQQLVTTTDSLVEGIHFLRKKISAEDLGWKSLAVNLSDLSAMGATPKWALLNLSLPVNVKSSWVEKFLEGFFQLAHTYDVQLIGGDTTASKKDIYISVTAMGVIRSGAAKLRSSAAASDLLCVTGALGSSRAGLALQSSRGPKRSFHRSLLAAHHRPRPRVLEGQWLAQQKSVHAMMDVSDGLLKDARRLAIASGVGVRVDAGVGGGGGGFGCGGIPVTQDFIKYCKTAKKSVLEEALVGGEDYELLFTVDSRAVLGLQKKYVQKFGHEFSVIGRVESSLSPKLVVVYGGKAMNVKSLKAFEHF